MSTRRICLWSGPRNVSTALMYAFAQRPDTKVVDEPLYAHYLAVSGARHPGREIVLASQENDGEKVVRDVVLGAVRAPIVVFKMMAHHLLGLKREFLRHTTNVLLVRDPREMLPSLAQQIPEPNLADTGLAVQSELFDQLQAAGQRPPVLDAEDLVRDPHGVLSSLCQELQIPFDPRMLSWSPGPRPEDGVWAPFWYHQVHRSSGFLPLPRKHAPLDLPLAQLLEQCAPHYVKLKRVAIAGGAAFDARRRLPS